MKAIVSPTIANKISSNLDMSRITKK